MDFKAGAVVSLESFFLGESTHSVDAKHRVFVPKRFQEVLDRNDDGNQVVYLTPGFERCLFLFSESRFQAALAALKTQAFGGAQLRRMQRLFFGNAHKTTLDGSGRVVLPEKLRTHAGLAKEVTMVGVGERAELWDKSAWESFEEESMADYDALDAVFAGEAVGGDPGGGGGAA